MDILREAFESIRPDNRLEVTWSILSFVCLVSAILAGLATGDGFYLMAGSLFHFLLATANMAKAATESVDSGYAARRGIWFNLACAAIHAGTLELLHRTGGLVQ
jgi:hypothetical protein